MYYGPTTTKKNYLMFYKQQFTFFSFLSFFFTEFTLYYRVHEDFLDKNLQYYLSKYYSIIHFLNLCILSVIKKNYGTKTVLNKINGLFFIFNYTFQFYYMNFKIMNLSSIYIYNWTMKWKYKLTFTPVGKGSSCWNQTELCIKECQLTWRGVAKKIK